MTLQNAQCDFDLACQAGDIDAMVRLFNEVKDYDSLPDYVEGCTVENFKLLATSIGVETFFAKTESVVPNLISAACPDVELGHAIRALSNNRVACTDAAYDVITDYCCADDVEKRQKSFEYLSVVLAIDKERDYEITKGLDLEGLNSICRVCMHCDDNEQVFKPIIDMLLAHYPAFLHESNDPIDLGMSPVKTAVNGDNFGIAAYLMELGAWEKMTKAQKGDVQRKFKEYLEYKEDSEDDLYPTGSEDEDEGKEERKSHAKNLLNADDEDEEEEGKPRSRLRRMTLSKRVFLDILETK